MQQVNRNLALFCDFENIALGVRDAKYADFNIQHVLERLLVKGSIIVKKAYCDWERYRDFRRAMHEAAFELIEIPHVRQSGKNSADIRMVVDALDLCYTRAHVDTFVIISGDSDFSPLVSKLRENARTVIGVGVKNSTSDLLISNCDEFIFYDDLVREEKAQKKRRRAPRRKAAVRGEPGGVETRTESPRKSDERVDRRRRGRDTPVDDDVSGNVAIVSDATDATDAERSDDRVEAAVGRNSEDAPAADEDRLQEAIDLVLETAEALRVERGEEETLWGSMVKQALKRRRPGFNESYYGARSFSELLEEAQARGLLSLELDDRSGGYIIRSVAVD